jgi:hypothetical protein
MRSIYFAMLLLIAVSCKKGFVYNTANIVDVNTSKTTDDVLRFELTTDAYYKGDKLEPSKVKWIIKDDSRKEIATIDATTSYVTWKAPGPGAYSIDVEMTFSAQEEMVRKINSSINVFASFAYEKAKIIGTFTNSDLANPSYNFTFTINSDYTLQGTIGLGTIRGIFYKANNNFSGCSINIDQFSSDGIMSGTITVRDSATNMLRTDLIREMKNHYYYYKLAFKQLYSADTTKYRYFDITRN